MTTMNRLEVERFSRAGRHLPNRSAVLHEVHWATISHDSALTAAALVRRYREMLQSLEGELAEIEAGFRGLGDVDDDVRQAMVRTTTLQMVDVLQRLGESPATTREALEALVKGR